tara:strand:- start:206 stop:997 length:792 start_codon:yes stop_codon:yes gene_type:complete
MDLVCTGDSWCYGSDLGKKDSHRNVLRYSTLLREKLDFRYVTNLAKPGISNSYIIFTLTDWLAENGYLTGKKDPSTLFISIGWTSPERFDIFPHKTVLNRKKEKVPYWKTIGPWIFSLGADHYPIDYNYKDYLEWFYVNCRSQRSDYSNWVTQVFMMQNLLENLGIRFIMHQAIYHNNHFKLGDDTIKHNKHDHTHILWKCVKEKNFLHKDKEYASLYSYLKKYHDGEKNVLNDIGDHPQKKGHEIICDLLYKHIKENKLWIN